MEIENRVDLTANWTQSERDELHAMQDKLLLSFDEETGFLPIEVIQKSPDALLAAFSLIQQGHVKLDSNSPYHVILTYSGKHLATQTKLINAR